jgi:hypothetical protein
MRKTPELGPIIQHNTWGFAQGHWLIDSGCCHTLNPLDVVLHACRPSLAPAHQEDLPLPATIDKV